MTLVELVEGWTSPIEFVMESNGVPIVFASSAHTPALILRNKAMQTISGVGNVSWLAASCGAVSLGFDSTDLVASESPYLFRIQVTQGAASSEVLFVPNGAANQLRVYAP